MKTFGMRLRDLREDGDFSQIDVAKKIKCSNNMISNYELDKRSPDFDTIIKLCDLFGVTADFLLGRVDAPKHFYESPLSKDEMELLKQFRQLPDKYKKDVLRYSRLNVMDYKYSGQ